MKSGVSIERESKDFIPASVKLRPIGDRIIVKPLDDNLSESIITLRDGRPLRGEVLAVGPGTYRKRRKQSPCGKYTIVTETDDFIPMSVKVGDVVQWGGLNIFDGQGYIMEELNWGNQKCLWITEKDVCGIEQV